MLSQLFTSKTRIQLLLKLFLNPDVSCYLRELATEFAVSPNAVKEELDSLTEAGYLEKQKKGRSIFFRANTRHPIFPELHSIVKKSLGIDRVVEEVKADLGDVQAVYILDDYALGKDSGLIDLLIVGEVKAERLQDYVRITEEKVRRKLRVLVLGMEEFEGSKQTFLQRPNWKVV
jgi:DNA-binding transcriptional ArsR family regulator